MDEAIEIMFSEGSDNDEAPYLSNKEIDLDEERIVGFHQSLLEEGIVLENDLCVDVFGQGQKILKRER